MLKNFELFSDNYIYELKEITDITPITTYIQNEKFNVKTENDFINLIKLKLIISTAASNYDKLKDFIDSKNLETIKAYSTPKKKYLLDKPLNEYIITNFKSILTSDNNLLIDKTLNLICEIVSNKAVFEYIVNIFMKNNQLFILMKHDKFFGALTKHKDLKPRFIKNLFIPVDIYNIIDQLNIINNYENSEKGIKERFERELLRTLKSESFQNEHIYTKNHIFEIILNNKSSSNNLKIQIECLLNLITKDLDKEIRTNGSSYPIKISIDSYIKHSEQLDAFRDKFFFIDYALDNIFPYTTSLLEKRTIQSMYITLINLKDSSITDIFINKSSNYSHGFQQQIEFYKYKNSLKLGYLIYNFKNQFWDELKSLYNDVLTILKQPINNIFIDQLVKLYELNFFEDSASKIVKEIEKLLRTIYIKKRYNSFGSGSEYVHIGLNDILSENHFGNLFSNDELKCFKYILIDSEGFNYRNSISHNNSKELVDTDTLYLLSVFIFILISIDYKEFD